LISEEISDKKQEKGIKLGQNVNVVFEVTQLQSESWKKVIFFVNKPNFIVKLLGFLFKNEKRR
jgi:hypothetical protein